MSCGIGSIEMVSNGLGVILLVGAGGVMFLCLVGLYRAIKGRA